MIDSSTLLEAVRELHSGVGVVDMLDETIERLSSSGRRSAVVAALDMLVSRVDDENRRQVLVHILVGTRVVRSTSNTDGTCSLLVEDDSGIKARVERSGDAWTDTVDGGGIRYTYFDEFKQRYSRLRDDILKEKLDELLVLDPSVILHGISGLRGELLRYIGWDPAQGETYVKFFNNRTSEMDRIFDEMARDREEFAASIDAQRDSLLSGIKLIVDSLRQAPSSSVASGSVDPGDGHVDKPTLKGKIALVRAKRVKSKSSSGSNVAPASAGESGSSENAVSKVKARIIKRYKQTK